MVTKEQAIAAGLGWGRTEFHCGTCIQPKPGPRGGVKPSQVETWRTNGACKTWVTRPLEFSLPIKHGLRDYAYITQDNAGMFHLASECPLLPERFRP